MLNTCNEISDWKYMQLKTCVKNVIIDKTLIFNINNADYYVCEARQGWYVHIVYNIKKHVSVM